MFHNLSSFGELPAAAKLGDFVARKGTSAAGSLLDYRAVWGEFEIPNQKSRRKAKANAKRGRTKFRFNPS